jgi:hypothetical protein
MKFDFGEVLRRARQIAWRQKSFWLIGILISLVSFVFASINLAHNPAFSSFTVSSAVNTQLRPIMPSNVPLILLTILSILFFVIGISIPSLGTVQLEQGSEKVSLGRLIPSVLPYFWRILGIVLVVFVGMFLATLILVVFAVSVSFLTLGFGLLCAFPLLILLVFGVILLYALMEEAVSAVLVDNLGAIRALQSGWELVSKYPRAMILMSLISYVVAFAAILMISIIMMMPTVGSGPNVQFFQMFSRNIILWTLAFLLFYAIIQGILLTFLQSVWTLIYLRLTRSATPS